MVRKYDVAIVGGGPAGAATAISLSRKGYSVVIVERDQFPRVRYGETLVPGARKVLVELGVWRQFLRDAHRESFGILSAWGTDALYENNFMFHPFGNGWHLDRVKFDAMLRQAAQEAGAEVIAGGQARPHVDNAAGQWSVRIDIGDTARSCSCRFLVDATGRHSFIAREQGATRTHYDHLIGAVAFVHATKPSSERHEHTLIEAQEDGWWYSAGLPGCITVIAFMTDADIYARSLQSSSEYWREQFQSTVYTKELVGSSKHISPVAVVASSTSKLDPVAGRNWLSVGDATMSFDPLSSQGIQRAMESGIAAAATIDRAFVNTRHSLDSFLHSADEAFDRYVRARSVYYLMERRWPKSAFWKRRHAH